MLLTVNREKTTLTNAWEGVSYLGFIIRGKMVSIHPKKIRSFKVRVKELTPRNHAMNVEEMVGHLNTFLRGWVQYFRIANCKTLIGELMKWIRRRLRMKQMYEWKSWKQLHKALRRRGYQGEHQKIRMNRWRNSNSPLVDRALPNSWFDEIGLIDLCSYKVGILSHFYE
jgi:RNA-directed DNA polymerase